MGRRRDGDRVGAGSLCGGASWSKERRCGDYGLKCGVGDVRVWDFMQCGGRAVRWLSMRISVITSLFLSLPLQHRYLVVTIIAFDFAPSCNTNRANQMSLYEPSAFTVMDSEP